jgi:flavin reductase (DIM6/NTAB) family NADH-FMN oxidoreductase RutF
MLLDVSQTDPLTLYQFLIHAVTPRPIAWVTSNDAEGRVNLAPFSFFNAFGANPPLVVFSAAPKRDGSRKDTLRNVEATGEFVLNAAVAELAEPMNLTARELPFGESEADLAGLRLVPSVKVRPPRVAASPVHMECVLNQVLSIGKGPGSANLIIGEVVLMHADDAVLDAQGRIDPHKLRTIGRLGGDYYCQTSALFTMKRP